jgi:hypothetical protein
MERMFSEVITVHALKADPQALALLMQRAEGRQLPLHRGQLAPSNDHSEWLTALSVPGVVELSTAQGSGALSLACRLLVHARAQAQTTQRATWLCMLDPTGTISAPALAKAQIPLAETIVMRPDPAQLWTFAVRACRSDAFAAVLIDATHTTDLHTLDTPMRRLQLSAEQNHTQVVLLTHSHAQRNMSLPTSARALVERAPSGQMSVQWLRHQYGVRGRMQVDLGLELAA